MAILHQAYCTRNGRIRIGRVPPSSSPNLRPSERLIAKGSAAHLRRAVHGFGRLSYDGKTWLVPGIPEAESNEAALDALECFREGIDKRLKSYAAEAEAKRNPRPTERQLDVLKTLAAGASLERLIEGSTWYQLVVDGKAIDGLTVKEVCALFKRGWIQDREWGDQADPRRGGEFVITDDGDAAQDRQETAHV